MKICNHCGSNLDQADAFCRYCGSNDIDIQCENCNTIFSAGTFCPICGERVNRENGQVRNTCPKCSTIYEGSNCPNCGYTAERPYENRNAWASPETVTRTPNRPNVQPEVYSPGYPQVNPRGYGQNWNSYNPGNRGYNPNGPAPVININIDGVPFGYRKRVSKWTSFFLCLFAGVFGAHKFYEGRIGMGLLYFFTGGLFGIGWIIDLLVILGKTNPYYIK